METIENKIKKLRKSKGINQHEIAAFCGIKQSSYANIENGKTKSISIEIGKGIAKALGVSFDELFEIDSDCSNQKDNTIRKLTTEISQINIRLKEKEYQIEYYKEQYRKYYILNTIQVLKDCFDSIFLLTRSVEEFKNKAKEKFQKQLTAEKKYTRDLISSTKNDDILSKTDFLWILYESDQNAKEIVIKNENTESVLTKYWQQYIGIDQLEVEQFLLWLKKRTIAP